MKWTGVLLVSGQSDDDLGSVERADALERLQRVQNHGVTTLHVSAAGASREGVETDEFLGVAFEDVSR